MAEREFSGGRRRDGDGAVSALLDQSGEVAPIDVVRFGRRAGEIIAGAARGKMGWARRERSRGRGPF